MRLLLADSGPVIPDFGVGATRTAACAQSRLLLGLVQLALGPVLQPALVQHIVLTLIAVGIGFVIACAAALVAHRHALVETPVHARHGLPLHDPQPGAVPAARADHGPDDATTVEIALVSYTLLILFRNTLAGLARCPTRFARRRAAWASPSARSSGESSCRWPLPAIIAGLRIATVTVISLATVAAFVVNEGLGAPIFAALQTSFNTELIAAGVLAIALALLADGLLAARAAVRHAVGCREEKEPDERLRPTPSRFMGDNSRPAADQASWSTSS